MFDQKSVYLFCLITTMLLVMLSSGCTAPSEQSRTDINQPTQISGLQPTATTTILLSELLPVTVSPPTLEPTTTTQPVDMPIIFTTRRFDIDHSWTIATLFRGTLDGHTEEQLVLPIEYAGDPVWSPNGQKIAFSGLQNGIHDLYVVNQDGTDLKQLTNDPFLDISPAWSPDGNQLAFVSTRTGNEWQIYILSLTTMTIRQLTKEGGTTPDWSPDSKQIVYIEANYDVVPFTEGIYITDVGGGYVRELANVCAGSVNYPAWSPDGQQIVFSCQVFDDKVEEVYKIHLVNVNGQNVQQLTGNDTSADETNPRWSGGGQEILFIKGGGELYVIDVNTKVVRRLFDYDTRIFSADWR